ncbi:MAG: hypothetical protein ACOX50_03295 [Patescibacteria group bacterium]|jgi:hypothetical protein
MISAKVLILMSILLLAAGAVGAITLSSNYLKANLAVDNLQEPTPTLSVAKAVEEHVGALVLEEFRYPQAEVLSLAGSSFQLRSFDDVQKVTDWYKEKISKREMTVRNFIQTNSNGLVSNQLLGANQQEQVKVTINKDGPAVGITVLITNKNDN